MNILVLPQPLCLCVCVCVFLSVLGRGGGATMETSSLVFITQCVFLSIPAP